MLFKAAEVNCQHDHRHNRKLIKAASLSFNNSKLRHSSVYTQKTFFSSSQLYVLSSRPRSHSHTWTHTFPRKHVPPTHWLLPCVWALLATFHVAPPSLPQYSACWWPVTIPERQYVSFKLGLLPRMPLVPCACLQWNHSAPIKSLSAVHLYI